ncbi:hypothetical protein SHKM778_94180 (plasmid) [Streptomyces sp. KM77-8]|uniref:Uncharacterized protein n=1 Tax=Streptomyces haneummycinicus TaxID=3074435 RepID=A0AAT9I0F5_9ACTN
MFDLVLGAAVVALAATHLYRPKSRKVRIAKDAVTVSTVVAVLAVWSQL